MEMVQSDPFSYYFIGFNVEGLNTHVGKGVKAEVRGLSSPPPTALPSYLTSVVVYAVGGVPTLTPVMRFGL